MTLAQSTGTRHTVKARSRDKSRPGRGTPGTGGSAHRTPGLALTSDTDASCCLGQDRGPGGEFPGSLQHLRPREEDPAGHRTESARTEMPWPGEGGPAGHELCFLGPLPATWQRLTTETRRGHPGRTQESRGQSLTQRSRNDEMTAASVHLHAGSCRRPVHIRMFWMSLCQVHRGARQQTPRTRSQAELARHALGRGLCPGPTSSQDIRSAP